MANNTQNLNNGLECAFCGKPKEHAKRLVAGPNGLYICDECLELCNMILEEEESESTFEEVELKKPIEIKSELDALKVRMNDLKEYL